jgi:hypothetical protein
MAFNAASAFSGCAPRTANLADYFGKNVPAGRDNGDLAFLQFLFSAQNLAGVRKLSDDITTVPGKKRGVKMLYSTPLCLEVCNADYVCGTARSPLTPAVKYAEYDLETKYFLCDGEGNPAELKFTDSEFIQYCELDDAQFLQEQFAETDMQFFKSIDKTLVQLLRTLIDVSKEHELKLMVTNSNTGTRTFSDEGLFWISEILRENEGTMLADSVIFGGRMVKSIQQKFKVATASTEGVDITALAGDLPALYFDRNFDSVFGVNSIVIIPKALLHPVTYLEYTSYKAFRGEKEINFTKSMPLGNDVTLSFDYQWRRDVDCPGYTYFPSLWMDLIKGVKGGCINANADGLIIIRDCGNNELPACPSV